MSTPLQSNLCVINFADEAPAIGSGHRLVVIVRDRKYVRLLNPATLQSAKLPMAEFCQMERRAQPAGVKPSRVEKMIRQKMREAKTYAAQRKEKAKGIPAAITDEEEAQPKGKKLRFGFNRATVSDALEVLKGA